MTSAEHNLPAQSLGQKLASLRKANHITQEQLAQMLNVSAQAVSKWERDKSCPDIMLLPEIAEALGSPLEELLAHDIRAGQNIISDLRIVHIEAAAPSGDRISVQIPMGQLDRFAELAKENPILKIYFQQSNIYNIVKIASLGLSGNILSIEETSGAGINIWIDHPEGKTD